MYKYITADAELTSIFSSIEKRNLYGLDIETMPEPLFKDYKPKKRGSKFIGAVPGLDPLLSYIRLIQIYDEKCVYICDIQKLHNLDPLINFLKNNTFVAHNAVFELKHIQEYFGIDVDCHCSMLAAKLVVCALYSPKETDTSSGESKYWHGFSLENLCAVYLKRTLNKASQVSDWSQDLTQQQLEYACDDAIATYDLFKYFGNKIKDLKLHNIYRLLKDIQPVVVSMEMNGMPVDWDKHAELVRKWEKELEEKKEVCKQYFGDINLNSNKQLTFWVKEYFKDDQDVLDSWARTEKGQFSFTRTKVKVKNNIKEVKALLEYKKIDKLLNSFGEPLLDYKHPKTGRIHSSYIIAGALTGRFSSRNPNSQQSPARNEDYRGIFSVKEGYIIVSDFSQIEVRLQGECSQDPVMLDTYRNGKDIYKVFASSMYHCDLDKVTKKQRQVAKSAVLGLAYGMGAKKFYEYCLVNDVDITQAEAEEAWKKYHSVFKVYSAWCKRQRAVTEKTNIASTKLNKLRRLHCDEIYTSSCNHMIQGSAAEVLMVTLRKCYDKIKNTPIKLLTCVHDEIHLYAPEGWQQKACTLLEESMVEGMQFVFPNAVVKDLAEAKFGKSWAEAK